MSLLKPQQPTIEQGATRTLLAMIVEDEPLIAMELEASFADEGFKTAGPFSTCADALASLEHAVPDLAVVDALLRDGSCLGLARELQRRGVPFIIHSGAGVLEEQATEFEGVPWIEKPSPVEDVVRAATGLLQP